MNKANWSRDLNHAKSVISDAKAAIENLNEASDGSPKVDNRIGQAAAALAGVEALLREADAGYRANNPTVSA
jgi:hypothetical protein